MAVSLIEASISSVREKMTMRLQRAQIHEPARAGSMRPAIEANITFGSIVLRYLFHLNREVYRG